MSKYAPGYTGPTTTAGPAKPKPKKPLMPKKPVIKATGMAKGGSVKKGMAEGGMTKAEYIAMYPNGGPGMTKVDDSGMGRKPMPKPMPIGDRTTMPLPKKPSPKKPKPGFTDMPLPLPRIKPTGMAKGGMTKKGKC